MTWRWDLAFTVLAVVAGRKLQGRSHRELHDLGLTVENGSDGSRKIVAAKRTQPAGSGGRTP